MKQITKTFICTGSPPDIAQIKTLLNELADTNEFEFIEQDANLENIKVSKTIQPQTDETEIVVKYKPGEFTAGDIIECVALEKLPEDMNNYMIQEGITVGQRFKCMLTKIGSRGNNFRTLIVLEGRGSTHLASNFIKVNV